MALAPSSLVMVGAGTLTSALFAPVEAVHAAAPGTGADEVGTDTDFKVSVRGGREGRREGEMQGTRATIVVKAVN